MLFERLRRFWASGGDVMQNMIKSSFHREFNVEFSYSSIFLRWGFNLEIIEHT